jgi:hypothetical protein
MLIAASAFQILRQVELNGDDNLNSAVLTPDAEVSDFTEVHAGDTNSGHEPIMPQDGALALLLCNRKRPVLPSLPGLGVISRSAHYLVGGHLGGVSKRPGRIEPVKSGRGSKAEVCRRS